MPRAFPLLLALTLMLGPAAAQQDPSGSSVVVPALPPSATTPSVPSEPVAPDPEPLTPSTPPAEETPSVPSVPAPSTPAPSTPAPSTPSAPAPLPSPASAQALQVVFEAPLKVLQDGQPVTASVRRTLTLPAERMAVLRQRGVITPSLEADLQTFLRSIPSKPQDARFEELTTGWALVQRDGYTVDLEQARARVLAALQQPATRSVTFSGRATAPARTLDYFVKRGLTAHLATGETNYYGSSAARITNIHVGTSKFQDRLFEGKTFSFNRMLGDINAANGFVPGLVIAGERTASGLGGGICQVSSTVFRALYLAGLPVVERRNHSYQVHYYDPQGLDATIYQPSQDLRFANDTGGALWLQADWDDKRAQLRVHVFGRPRDFTVQLGTPRTLSSTPAPADRLIADSSLPAGTRQQVDWAAPGAVIEVQRRFVRNGQVVRSDTLRSSYRPWPNIYLVGTKK
ncbi:VanW family protein [Deinococcus sonorensis]|uniref:VanW family protein n=2 Tax=Deinococcus sonorensis TaxID=309891 RepID=A0AAU7UE83_9DEIO